jgi:hypothetical protein
VLSDPTRCQASNLPADCGLVSVTREKSDDSMQDRISIGLLARSLLGSPAEYEQGNQYDNEEATDEKHPLRGFHSLAPSLLKHANSSGCKNR